MEHLIDNLNNVLFIRLGAIGDVVHTIPTVQALKELKPALNIDYLTGSSLKVLLDQDPALRTVISIDDNTYKSYVKLYKLAKEISKVKYDAVVNLQPGMKTFFITGLINSKYTFTYKKYRSFKKGRYKHVVKNYYETIKSIFPNANMPSNIELKLQKDTINWAKQELLRKNIHNPVGIVPGVSKYRSNKLWVTENWKTLLDYLTNKKKYQVLIFGGRQEIELANILKKANETSIINICGDYNVLQTAAIISHCELVIGCDTGPTHIASAIGPKVIGLYGPTSPERVGLFGNKHINIGEKGDCFSCERKKCHKIKDTKTICPCMKAITVENVIEKLEQ